MLTQFKMKMKTTNLRTPFPRRGWGRLFLLLAILGLSNAYSQVGIGTTTPHASAALDLESTNKGFLPPRMNTSDRDAISNPPAGLTIYNTDIRCLDTYNGVRWITCNTIGATDVYNPVTGQVWMDRNLGASQVATSSADAAAYGDLYQWGRAADGHEKRTSGTTTTNASTAVPNASNAWNGLYITNVNFPFDWLSSQDNTLWQGVNGTNNPCPSGYRVPTATEWDAERLSWSSDNNAAGAYASPLKLSVAGNRYHDTGAPDFVDDTGFYWSSTVDGLNAQRLFFNSSNADISISNRAFGSSVRCLKD
mgnify:CR=1 FL=1